MYILKWLWWKLYKNVFYKLNVLEIVGIKKKMCVFKVIS